MNLQSLLNVTKNILEIYSVDEDLEEDLRDNIAMLVKIGKLSTRDQTRFENYVSRYQAMKGI